jgi:hypothetical protein
MRRRITVNAPLLICVTEDSDRSGNFDFWTMKTGGSDQTQLTTDLSDESFLRWSTQYPAFQGPSLRGVHLGFP